MPRLEASAAGFGGVRLIENGMAFWSEALGPMKMHEARD